MKKLICLILLLSLMTPIFASEQSVLNDATAAFYGNIKGDVNTIPQADRELLGLCMVTMQYMVSFNSNNLVDAGNLMLRRIPKSTIPQTKEAYTVMAITALTYGHSLNLEFTEAHKYLNKLALYKDKTIADMNCKEMYDSSAKLLNTIEKMYTQAKSMGYDDSDIKLKQQIRRQLGL